MSNTWWRCFAKFERTTELLRNVIWASHEKPIRNQSIYILVFLSRNCNCACDFNGSSRWQSDWIYYSIFQPRSYDYRFGYVSVAFFSSIKEWKRSSLHWYWSITCIWNDFCTTRSWKVLTGLTRHFRVEAALTPLNYWCNRNATQFVLAFVGSNRKIARSRRNWASIEI
jgi:hypothetical protein